MSDASRPGAGRVLAKRYRLVQHLASGGMAEVWEATDEVLARPVAVKLLHGHLADDDALRARFHHEAVAAARLVHPSIVAIFDTCEEPGAEAIIMELVRGRTLRQFLDERRRLEPVEVVHIGSEVSAALACAHEAGIIHRDVKPANILLSDDGRVLVTDFGIAKVLDEPDLTRTSQLLGTVKYLAPEQVESKPVDARTDIYALGAVLYESLCGEAPFRADNPAALALARLQRDPAPPHDVVAGVPPPLDAALVRALARRPEDRFATAGDLRSALLSTRLGRWGDETLVSRSELVDDGTRAGPDVGGSARDAAHREGGEPPAAGTGWGGEGADGGGAAQPGILWATPAGGTPAPSNVSPPTRRPGTGLIVGLVVVGALVLVALLVASTDLGGSLFPGDSSTSGSAALPALVPIADARSFDPQGTGPPGENEQLAANAIDGRAETSWRTETYRSRDFGNLKTGVGLELDLATSTELGPMAIASPTTGWSVSIYVADGRPTNLAGWGDPVADEASIDGSTTLDLDGATGSTVLVWITDLGDGPTSRVDITDIALGS